MVTKEELNKISKQEVAKLLRKKQIECKTVAEEVEMYYTDAEYIAIKERLEEFYEKGN
jgi:hypothetical protein